MEGQEIRLLQEIQMQIMDEIHRICIVNGLKYYLIGGSAIGAIRHRGIIPWDMDIDIAMPRCDYQRLINVFPQQCDERYSLQYYKTIPNFNCPHILICLKDSFISFGDNEMTQRYGIYVDVLPLDQCPNSLFLRWMQANEIKCTWGIVRMQQIIISNHDGFLKRVIKKTVRALSSTISRDYINHIQQRIMMQYDKCDNCTHCCSMASHYSYKRLCMPIGFFGEPTLMSFSGREYFVPQRIEDYLTQLFGDYNKLPSKKDQEEQMNKIKCASWRDKNGTLVLIGEGISKISI